MKVGFIGFGEAASSIALGLHEEGVEQVLCYDVMQDDVRFLKGFEKKRAACEGEKMADAAHVCEAVEIVISAAQSNYAVAAAESALEGITRGLLFMDVSTATPIEKKKMAQMIEMRGGLFVDGAMMGALLKDKHKVPMLLSGAGAQELKEKMAPYHMNLKVVSKDPGTATSIKFIRSITAKGLSCLLIESLQPAQRFGVEHIIVESFLDTFGPDFLEIINGYVSGAIIHADRREHEMLNVVDFLKSEELPYTMAEATREKLQWLRDDCVKDRFDNGVPRDWVKVLEGWKLGEECMR